MSRLATKVAIVIGAASGIGLGIAHLFAIFIECDISSAESVKNLVAKTVQAFGTIDILINNAA